MTILTVDLLPIMAIFVIAIFVLYIALCKKRSDDWEKYGVKQAQRSPLMSADFGKACIRMFRSHGRTFGAKNFRLQLFTTDLNLLKSVLVTDFQYFPDNDIIIQSKSKMMKGLFFAKGDDWRRLRHLVTPTFSSSKLKLVVDDVNRSAYRLAQYFRRCALENKLVGIKHTAGQYTSEIIAKTAFGIQTNCLGNEDDPFTRHAKQLIKSRNLLMKLLMGVLMKYPSLYSFLVHTLKIEWLDGVSQHCNDYFESLLKSTMEDKRKRRGNGTNTRTDFLDMLMAASENGEKMTLESDTSISCDRTQKTNGTTPPETLSQDEIMGQSILITFAALETTAITLQMVLYILAKHPGTQERVFHEIQATVSSQTPTFEELQNLKYTEQVIKETLRLFPVVTFILRTASATRTYGHITIPKGCMILIPIPAVTKNPRNFPDPEKFDPSRFSPENVARRDPMTFLPFGYGPRVCLGKRLAFMEVKAALVHALREVRVEMSGRTEPKAGVNVEVIHHFLLTPKKPIQLEMRLRKSGP